MKKTFITTLSLLLALTIVGFNNSNSVFAEDLENPITINEESAVTPKTVADATTRLKGLSDQLTTELNGSGINSLISKNLNLYQSKANAMLAKEPAAQVESELDDLSNSIKIALLDVQYNLTLNELESMMTLSLVSYDKTSATNYVSLTQLAKEMLNTINNEINAGIPLATLTKIPAILSDLKAAKETLIKNDYTALNKAITEAKKYNLSNYSPSTAQVVTNALAKANEALTIEISATELITHTNALNDAVAGLEELMLPEQKVILDSFLIKVKEFNDLKHSEASKKLIYDMDFKVKAFLNKEIKSLLEAERLLQEITQIETLMVNPDIKEPVLVNKTELNSVIIKANALLKGSYSDDSWIIFQDTLTIAKDVNNNESVLQEMIDMALGNLNQAMQKLQLKPSNKPIVHPFDEMPEYIYVGESFTLKMGTPKTIVYDKLIFEVKFGTEVKFIAKAAGMSEIKYTDVSGKVVKYLIETREKEITIQKEDIELPNVGITPDNSVMYTSSMLIISGFGMILLNRKQEKIIENIL